ncbi:MAG TPA: thymidine kinase, partial [Archangium sp.]
MAKLYFRYGSVGSAKTLNLLAVAHSYTQQSKRVLVIKPEMDTRFGKEMVKSRAGLEREADMLVTP